MEVWRLDEGAVTSLTWRYLPQEVYRRGGIRLKRSADVMQVSRYGGMEVQRSADVL